MQLPSPISGVSGGGPVERFRDGKEDFFLNFTDFLASRRGRVSLAVARVTFWTTAIVIALALCRRGLTLGDEGYILSQAADILAGKVPYVDLDLFVTPGAWYLIAGLFSITGPSVIATRVAAAVGLLAMMVVTRRVVRASGGPLWGDFAAGLIAIFAVWAWPAWTFSFYSPWASLAAMAALACALEWMRSRHAAWLVLCGAMLGLTIAFKQNYGVFAAAGCAMAVLLDEIAVAPSEASSAWREIARRFRRPAMLMAVGGSSVLLPLVAWLAHQGALAAAFDALVLRPFQGFVEAHSIRYLEFGDLWRRTQIWEVGGLIYLAVPVASTGLRLNWPATAVRGIELLHFALYWIPVIAFWGLGVTGLRRVRHSPSWPERALLATTVFAAAFFLGVFTRADFNHLINVYQPVLAMLAAAGAVYFGQGRWRTGTGRRIAAGLAGFTFLCFAVVAAVWMNELRKLYWIPLDAPRAGVLVEPLAAEMINHEISLLRGMTAEGEPVFALPGLSMIPFLAERPMPTRYYNYYSVHIGHDKGLEAAQEIERSGAKVVLADYNNFFADPVGMLTYGYKLTSYINRTFRPVTTLSNQTQVILKRREEPLDEVPSLALSFLCELGGTPGRYVREHLLFATIYHSFRGAWADHNQRTTICQVLVPTAARLRMGLELYQPALAVEPAEVRAQAWVLPDHGAPRRLLDHRWELESESACSRSAGAEVDVDLSRWEGKSVTVILRTLVDGEIPPSGIEDLGLSVMWNNARIESPDHAPKEIESQ